MVKLVTGDIFESKEQTLVNTVNCVGVMGKGISLEFKKRFPEMYKDYARRCKAKEVRLGQPYLYKSLILPWILNFPTKDHWRSVSRLEDIARGLQYLERHYKDWGITSLAVPPLGCGEGQLDWSSVGPTLYQHLKPLEIGVVLYAPYGTPHQQLQPAFLERMWAKARDHLLVYLARRDKSGAASLKRTLVAEETGSGNSVSARMKPSWVALVKILEQIENEPYHYQVGRTSFQKIAYFATASGIPTGLSFQRGSFGPYAADLKLVISRLVNNGVVTENRLGRMLAVVVGPTFKDAYKAYEKDIAGWNKIIAKVADLFLRVRTDQAELAATVHFAAKSLSGRKKGEKPSEMDVLDEVLSWKQRRKPQLSEGEVAWTIRNLSMLGWLDVDSSSKLPVSEEALLGV